MEWSRCKNYNQLILLIINNLSVYVKMGLAIIQLKSFNCMIARL